LSHAVFSELAEGELAEIWVSIALDNIEIFNFKQELETLFARSVDVIELEAMPDTRLKRIIERTEVAIYGA